MRTALELLDWAQDWVALAGDGFKAELLWLGQLAGLQDHAVLQSLTFNDPEWEAFAAAIDPDAYSTSWHCQDFTDSYDSLQRQAVCAFKRGEIFDTPITGELNDRAHKVIWCSGFGTRLVNDTQAAEEFLSEPTENLSLDDQAKIYLALVLLGQDAQEPPGILTENLIPQTYHEILCVLVANFLKETLQ